MQIIIFYVPIIVCVLLPIVFRSRYRLRAVCVAVLAFLGFLHWMMLSSLANTLENSGIRHYADGKLPDDFRVAVKLVRELNEGQSLFVLLLIAGFTILALLPRWSAQRMDKPDA
jgi:hypothetical protein